MSTLGLTTIALSLIAHAQAAGDLAGYVELSHRLNDDSQRVCATELCVVHQALPTAKDFYFLTLEDEWGMINVVVSPGVVIRDGKHLHGGRVLLVEGVVQREAKVVNLIAQGVEQLGVG